MPELALFRHGEELLRIPLGDLTTIGRDAACDVALPDPALSRVQAAIERRGAAWLLVDRSGRGNPLAAAWASEARDAPLAEDDPLAAGGARLRPGESLLDDGAEFALGTWRALFRARDGDAAEETRVSGGTELRARDDAGEAAERLRVRERGRERVLRLDGARAVTIGKEAANDVVLDDPYVSARHLRLERRDGRWHLRDLGSTNGTFAGGARVVDCELLPARAVQLGDCELELDAGDGRPRRVMPAFEGMIAADPGMRAVFDLVERVGPAELPACVFGETGTGKELVARALHARSPRKDAPFIPVNCSAIAETLIESELFGHEKGAFSGAERLRKGAFEEADGGTIFLDEIGELPLDLQPKLLRTLEQGEVKRVGASRPITVNVRVVAATHRDLRAAVRANRFREDLFYRLCVVPMTVPPLRQRRGDVRALADEFLERASPRGLPLRFSEDALRKLEEYDWPGNVRQLKNAVLRSLLFRGEGLVVGPQAIALEDTRTAPTAAGGDDDTLYLRGLTMEDVEREAIRLSLRRHKGKRAAVVQELRIAKSTVMKRIGQWGLQHEGRPGGAPADDEDDAE